jgi:hypothetical protein
VRALTVRNILLALLLSLLLTLAFFVLYTFYPLISLVLSSVLRGIVSRSPESNGIAAVAGGVSESFLKTLVLIVPILFLIIFALLQKRSLKG